MEPRAPGNILTLNAGSSSLKFALFRPGEPLARVLTGKIERIGLPEAELSVTDLESGSSERRRLAASSHSECVPPLTELLRRLRSGTRVAAVGHRVVHGGAHYQKPALVTEEMLGALRQLEPFAPEHMPAEIALMEEIARRLAAVPQVACFDTAFHADLPRVAQLLPIPRRYEQAGVRRYGFHGLSYTYLHQELERLAGAAAAGGRVIFAHLGNGASMAAVRGGRPIDTTMAFTPAAGLVMSTRTGDLDPGLVAYLARTEGMTPQEFDKMINSASGLLGVSGTSPDVRDLLAREAADTRAAEALALFVYAAKKWVGALAAALGGLDTVVFAGGIGENSAVIRARICGGLEFLGIEVEPARNEENAAVISSDRSRACVRVIRTDEELLIARATSSFLKP